MRHARFQEQLAHRHELTGARESALLDHLASCAACRRLAGEYQVHEEALGLLVGDPPTGLRAAILTRVGQAPAHRRPAMATLGLATAAAVFILSLGAARFWGPFGAEGGLLSKTQAVRAALNHTVVARDRTLPPTVKVTARLGAYGGVEHAWLVTISGPGVSVLSPQAVLTGFNAQPLSIVHKETAVVDGRTGAYIEAFAVAG